MNNPIVYKNRYFNLSKTSVKYEHMFFFKVLLLQCATWKLILMKI